MPKRAQASLVRDGTYRSAFIDLTYAQAQLVKSTLETVSATHGPDYTDTEVMLKLCHDARPPEEE